MSKHSPTQSQLIAENRQLRAQLAEAEETLRAIRTGEVDALVVSTDQGDRVFTLKGSDYPYRVLIEQMNQGAATLSPDGLVTYCNHRLAEILRTPLQHVIGSSIHDWIAPAEGALLHALLRGGDQPHGQEIALQAGDGTLVPAHLFISRFPLDDAQQNLCLIATDLTEHKRSEAILAARTAESEARAGQLRALAMELINAEQSERRRVAQLMHDSLQQRLAATKLRLNIVQGRISDAALLQRIQEASTLIDESMEESRSLTGQLSPLVLYELGLASALAWLGQQMQAQHGLAVEVQAAPDANPSSEETAVLLFHAVRELLFNVTKHAGVAEARVILDRLDGTVRVTVEDRGGGFDPAAAAALDVSKGSFGLFTIRERLEAIGGHLAIDSTPGQGARILLLAPEAATVRPPMAPSASRVGPVADRGAASRTIRVLVADDHPIVRSGLAALLHDEPDIDVIGEAADGVMALAMARHLKPDVVIMDVTMPRMNGLDATRLIVRELPDVRVIGLSIHGHEQMAASMRRAGAVAYLHKGGPPEALIAAIHDAVAPSAPLAADQGDS